MKKTLNYSLVTITLGVLFLAIVSFFTFGVSYEKTELPRPYIQSQQQEAVSTVGQAPIIIQSPLFHYIEIQNGCDWSYVGECVHVRSGPGLTNRVLISLRTGIVLKVEATTTTADGHEWYKIIFDGNIRYPERITSDWYVAANSVDVRPFTDKGDSQSAPGVVGSTTKRIVVNLSKQTLSAYDGDKLFMQESISTGLEFTPTPIGKFTVYKKTPSRYMQGPIPQVSDQYYDLPGVSWNLYFTVDGAVIHGAYWHNSFGQQWSHGCVNLLPQQARMLYDWAVLGTPVIVQR